MTGKHSLFVGFRLIRNNTRNSLTLRGFIHVIVTVIKNDLGLPDGRERSFLLGRSFCNLKIEGKKHANQLLEFALRIFGFFLLTQTQLAIILIRSSWSSNVSRSRNFKKCRRLESCILELL